MLALRLGSRKVHSLAFSPDGRTLAAGAGASVVTLDWQSGREVARYHPSYRLSSACRVIDFGSDGATLTGCYTQYLAVTWDVRSQAVLGTGPRQPNGTYTHSGTLIRGFHPAAMWAVRYRGSDSRRNEVVPVASGPVRFTSPELVAAPSAAWWDATTGRLIGWWPTAVIAYELPRPRPRVRRSFWEKVRESVKLDRPPDPLALVEVGRYPPPPTPVSAVAPCPDGRSVLLGGGDQPVVWWDFVDGVERARWRWPVGWVRSLAVDPAGTVAAVGGSKGKAIIWDWGG